MDPKLPILAPYEVVVHNSETDCWLSFLGKVYDITPLIQKHKDERCVRPLLAFAGKDVSHWFNERTGELQNYINPITGVELPYCPHGRIPDVTFGIPTTLWRPLEGVPWWKDDKYLVGYLTKKVLPLRIINMLIFKQVQLNVCFEDTFERIQQRYSAYNTESDSYTWVYGKKLVEMDKTMEENGIIDERERMAELGIPRNYYVPSVRLYYNDDLRHFEDLSDDEPQEEEDVPCD